MVCVPCARGHIAVKAQTECMQCAPGTMQVGTACERCGGNTISTASRTACEACQQGHLPDANHTTCVPCRAGTKQVGLICDPCGGRTYSAGGVSFCAECDAGSIPFANHTGCEACAAGRFQIGAICDRCPRGTIAATPGASVCTACASGLEPNTAATACVPCASGTFSHQTPTCQACEPGWFTNTTGRSECFQCPPGSHSPARAATKCYPCQRGTYATLPASVECLDCPANHYSERGAAQCVECPPVGADCSKGVLVVQVSSAAAVWGVCCVVTLLSSRSLHAHSLAFGLKVISQMPPPRSFVALWQLHACQHLQLVLAPVAAQVEWRGSSSGAQATPAVLVSCVRKATRERCVVCARMDTLRQPLHLYVAAAGVPR